ncbi:histone-lysine N-methyltransferase PRDM9-like [Tachysurus ichikawai]
MRQNTKILNKHIHSNLKTASLRQLSQTGGFQRKPIKEEEPEDDEFFYCEDCGSHFINKCEVHGPALFISDTPVPLGIADRAIQTLPPGLEVRKSDVPDAGLGVFNKGETIPLGAHFGPYEGDLVDKEEAMNSDYSWVIFRSSQCEKYIDGEREMHSNWMRYVNCARNEEEQNLVAFQYRGGILYRCCQPIKPGQELLMWYKDDYGKNLGLVFDSLWKKKCSSKEMNDDPLQLFSCTCYGRTSSSVGFIILVDEQKPIKKEEPEDEGYSLGGGTSSPVGCAMTSDQHTAGFQKKSIKEEEREDDEFLYCEDCKSYFINKCEVHGPALFISDTPVPLGITNRATQTLPPGLEVRKSDVPDAGLGVFNKGETIPLGAHFGPYEGDLVDKEEAVNSAYSWVISRRRRCEKYIDGQRETHSNWMRYVNCSRNEEEQNLVAFQYRGGILYRCCQPIKPGQELMMWYKDDYGKNLGLAFDYLWKKKCSSKGYVQSYFIS